MEDKTTIKKTYGVITVDHVKDHISKELGQDNPSKKMQAQIRQTVTTEYPAGKIGNDMNDSIFDEEEFSFGEGQTYKEERVAWIDVPLNSTKEQVETRLKNYPNARIYKRLSLAVILNNNQKLAIQTGISKKTIDEYKNSQTVVDIDSVIQMYHGFPQFRVTGFSKEAVADIDDRPSQLPIMMKDATETFQMNAPVESEADFVESEEQPSATQDVVN